MNGAAFLLDELAKKLQREEKVSQDEYNLIRDAAHLIDALEIALGKLAAKRR